MFWFVSVDDSTGAITFWLSHEDREENMPEGERPVNIMLTPAQRRALRGELQVEREIAEHLAAHRS